VKRKFSLNDNEPAIA